MRQALSKYWRAHGEEAVRKVTAAAGTAGPTAVNKSLDAIGTSPKSGSHETTAGLLEVCGVVGLDGNGGCRAAETGGEREVVQEGRVSSAATDGGGGGVGGPWAGLSGRELQQLLAPFLSAGGGEKGNERNYSKNGERSPAAAVTDGNGEDSSPRSLVEGAAVTGSAAPVTAASVTGSAASPVSMLSWPHNSTRQRPAVSPHENRSPPCCVWEAIDFDPAVVLRCLSPRRLCMVITALLCERKVVMVSSRLSLLTMAGEVFR